MAKLLYVQISINSCTSIRKVACHLDDDYHEGREIVENDDLEIYKE